MITPSPDSAPNRLLLAEFNALCRAKAFADGPFRDGFGDGPGEPYIPRRKVWGTLGNGRMVWSETGETE